ncbi:ribosome-binding factor A [bacterium E08(2017)]|nr:ribosome-binding factor A [bacterium E08(2017)]
MSVDRINRVNELLRREISDALLRLLSSQSVDLSAYTVTRVITSRNLRHARVMVSIRDHENERGSMMALVKKHRKTIQEQINKDLVLKYTPRLTFELDDSVEKGDRVLDILTNLDIAEEDDGPWSVDGGPDLETGEEKDE